MPVETFNFLDSLNASNPVSTDGQVQGDDHIRGIKAAIKATFPSIAGACAITDTQLSNLGAGNLNIAGDGSAVAPSIGYASDATIGFYKISTGIQGITGRLLGNGAVEVGAIVDFIHATIPAGYYSANGQSVPRTGSTAALFALIGTTYGAGNGTTTFNLPNLELAFLRASGPGRANGTFEGDGIRSHTSAVSGVTGSHSHAIGVSLASADLHANPTTVSNEGGGGGAASLAIVGLTGGASIPVSGSMTFNTSCSTNDALSVSGTATYTGAADTHPFNYAVVRCIKS